MTSEDSLPVLKVLIIGPSGAGKSALLLRYCDDQFDPESSTATIGIDFKSKKLAVRGKAYRLNVFDTAGQERFRTLSTSYYRGAHGVILVYDIASRKSFLSMERWIDEARANAAPDAALYLVGSKLDKVSSGGRAISFDEGKAFAESHGAGFCEVSSKTRENVRKPFVDVVDRIVQTPQLLTASSPGGFNGTALNIGNLGTDYSSACPC
ncbi:P-loop containing nucleoside triphosphate hydrolase protein [Pseudomassariella vexata]|uniref:p-loop containing nucleoside triphosphate hydrolase protein n=1 Tax=Pseudomassariella vexata TaxID=1141098 RepID=A0A1Y2EKG9_9PEZI|nr:P-loop containing nucleoside triphosphate hydrolase protein [Pseudomassariella vexata]ORY72040.1 P-loop containing nucleoside triphosphate hydrolase protein [Pseudomassariella vexata]